MNRLKEWAAAFVLLLAPAIPLWRTVFYGDAIGPFDQIRTMAPWNGPIPARPWDVGSRTGGLVAGVAFSLSPFMLSWTGLASAVTTLCWVPWTLYFLTKLAEPAPKSAQLKWVGLLALSAGMMILGGHLQFTFYGFLAAALLTLGYWIGGIVVRSKTATMSLGLSLLGLGLGIALSSAQLLPVLQFGKLSNRQNHPSESGYSSYVSLAIQPFEWGGLTNPAGLGLPSDSVDAQNQVISTYWPLLVKNGANYAESALCIGPIVLALLALVSWRDRKIIAAALVAVIALLMAIGAPIDRLFYFDVPGWSATGSPGRIVVLFVMIACVLAGTAMRRRDKPVSRNALLASGGLLALGALLSLYCPQLAPAAQSSIATTLVEIQAAGAGRSLNALLMGTGLGVAVLAIVAAPNLARVRPVSVGLVLAYCGLLYGFNLVPTGAPLDPVKGPPSGTRVAYLNQTWGIFKPTKSTMPPNLASLNRIHEMGGYDSLLSGDTVLMLTDLQGENPAPPSNGNMMLVKNLNEKKLAQAGVSFVGLPNGLQPIPKAPGRVSLSHGVATIADEDYSSLTVRAEGSGLLTLRDRMMPGWSAEVDGMKVDLPKTTWRTLTLSRRGPHIVIFKYDPPGLSTGMKISGASILAILALFVLGFRKEKPQRDPEPIGNDPSSIEL
jgi:hypothetical protein